MSERYSQIQDEEALRRSMLEQVARRIAFVAEGAGAPEARIKPNQQPFMLPGKVDELGISVSSDTIEAKEIKL